MLDHSSNAVGPRRIAWSRIEDWAASTASTIDGFEGMAEAAFNATATFKVQLDRALQDLDAAGGDKGTESAVLHACFQAIERESSSIEERCADALKALQGIRSISKEASEYAARWREWRERFDTHQG